MPELEDIEAREQVGWGFWVRWMLASFVGFSVGFGILLATVEDEGSAVIGASVGIAQWLVLRGQVSGPGWWGWWVLASFVGFAVGGATPGVTLGASVGIAQWVVLRGQVSRPGWWVLASIVGGVVGGAVGGLFMYWAITGVAMVWLLRQPKRPLAD